MSSRIAIMVNANAKRGGRRIAAQIARMLPDAAVSRTRSTEDATTFLRTQLAKRPAPTCIFAAGGDGTAVALINALAALVPAPDPLPPIGVLPLGTGNAWANSGGSPKLGAALQLLRDLPRRADGRDGVRRPLPFRRYGLIECQGTLTHFAGCGWDAQILNDYKEQLEAAAKGPPRAVAKSVYGYLGAMLFRTTPKALMYGRPHVLIENLGDVVWTIGADGKLLELAGVKHGTILYDGLASVAGAATCPEFGYRFRAYPHAERFLGRMNVRIYDRSAALAIKDIPRLWVGQHPLRGMHDWFATHVRMTFSRPMPLQIGGDATGLYRTVELAISERQAHVLDWRALK